jgi:pyruvate,water dikinase
MEHNKIIEKITTTLSELQIDKLDVLNSKSHELQEQIIKAEIPRDLEKEILDAYRRLCDRYGKKVMVSVRSSALQEDGTFSFA